MFGATLDEDSFVQATTDPQRFQRSYRAVTNPSKIKLKPYAVGIFAVNDDLNVKA